MKRVVAADLFCGAGGTSTGLIAAARALGYEVDLIAVNHWEIAIGTHSANHPEARHYCQTLDSINPREAVPSGKLDLLLASPECTHFSTARGGKPMSDQSRASAWCILRWLDALEVRHVIIENVPEFETWGPIHSEDHADEKKRLRPVEKRKGAYFRNFVRNLKTLGYSVDWRVLNAANYGDATTRKRLFLQARKGRRAIVWPEPTHLREVDRSQTTFSFAEKVRPWRPAREIIDWDLKGESIFKRKRPLAPNTLARIYAGLRKFSGLPFVLPHQHGTDGPENVRDIETPLPTITGTSADMFLAEPFLVVLRNHGGGRSLDDPAPAIVAGGNHLGLAQPYVIPLNHGKGDVRSHSLDSPFPTITSVDAWGVVEPFMIGQQSGAVARSVEEPTPTIAGAGAIALAEPFLVPNFGERDGQAPRTHSVDDPLPAVTGHGAGALVEPFLVGAGGPLGQGGPRSVEEPLRTVLADPHQALAEPYLVEFHGGRDADQRTRSVEEPLPTADCSNRFGVAAPFLLRFNSSDRQLASVEEPMPAIDTRDRYALVHPELVRSGQVQGEVIGWLDIRFRMLQPHELAAAMSFPADYQFTGTREQKVKQIGNAVPVSLARALCGTALEGMA